jgi:hypothetical protein
LVIGTNVQAYSSTLSGVASVSSGLVSVQSAGSVTGVTITAGAGISVANGNGVGGNPTISAAVTSVQGQTGAVTVSVPVTSVQGQTGAVTVSSVGYAQSAGYAGSAGYASNSGGGWPGHLSQFANNLGNYGGWVPHNQKQGPGGYAYGSDAGQQGNCGNIINSYLQYMHLDQGSGLGLHHYQQNCHNCNCNC